MKTNFKTSAIRISSLLILNLIIFNLQSSNAQMFWNQACRFAGNSNSYVSVPNSSSINLTGSFTIEAWVNPSSLATTQGILSKGGVLGSNLEYALRINSGGRIQIATNGIIRLMSKPSTVLSTNNWSHIVATFNSNANAFVLYRNGVLDTAAIVAGAAPPSDTDSLFIGISGAATPFNGQLDEVRLWNRQLSMTEVGQSFRTSLGAAGGIYDGLVMSLTFQNNQSSGVDFSLIDWSGNNNNGVNRNVSAGNQIDRPYVTIMPNESVELDGNEDFLSCPDASEINPTSAITLECWVFPRNANLFTFMTKGNDYTLFYNGSAIQVGINGTFFSTGVGLSINQWTHMAFSYSTVTDVYSLYLNGVLRASANFSQGSINNGTDSLYIGGSPGFPDLNGYIDEVRISNYAKSQQDINRYLYQSIESSNDPNAAGIDVVFNLDGLSTNSCSTNGLPKLFFRNNARFSNPGCTANKPVSPLNRNDGSAFSSAYYMTTSNKRIPASGTSGTILDSTTVNLNATIIDVNLFVALNHTNNSNIEVVLVAPNGDSVKVFDNKVTNSLDNNLTTIFNDQADSSLISNRYSSFATIIRPENNMNSVFSGDNSLGNWKLIVRDEVTNDEGFLYAWGIQFNSSTRKDLTLSGLIQGFYNSSTNLMVPDTMRVYIRNSASPFAILDSSKTLLNNSGSGLFSYSNNLIINNQQYYIQLKHRNSIETWSNPFTFVNDAASYSFLNAANSAFGNNQIQVDNSPIRFAIYGGDVNQDGVVDATDASLIDNDAFNFVTGYVNTDLTGENVVDASDAAIADNNAFNFVGKITP